MTRQYKVLIACEFSGVVREEFRKMGFDSWSCDILPAEDNSPYHIQDDVLKHLNEGWDLMIAHPPCTYLCNSGVHWIYRQKGRWNKMEEAREFFLKLWNAPIPYIAIENPIPHKYANLPEYSQIIQPYYFGDRISKKTCLWLKNLPLLTPTRIVKPERAKSRTGKEYDKWWLETSRVPYKERWKVRSKTFRGIAEAMAEQWGDFLLKQQLNTIKEF